MIGLIVDVCFVILVITMTTLLVGTVAIAVKEILADFFGNSAGRDERLRGRNRHDGS